MLSREIAWRLLAIITVASVAMPVSTSALPGLREQQQGDIEFISGGVGEREREALVNISRAYNLFMTMTNENGAYLADVHVILRDEGGQTVLDTTTRGPFLLADLPPGRYQIEAEASGERTERTKVNVVSGQLAHAYFSFPST